jgi:hypothetical protein
MSDIKSMLPIRSAQDADQRVQVKIVDSLVPTQQTQVDAQRNLHVKIHGTDAGGTDRILLTSESGNIIADAIYNASTNTKPSSQGVVAAQRAATPGLTDMLKRVTAISNGTTHALDISLHDEAGAAYSYANPLNVTLVESPGAEIQDYFEDVADVAVGATHVHTYTVPAGKILKLDQVLSSGSGRLKVLIEQSQDGTTFLKVATRFNATATPNCDTSLNRIVSVPAGGKVRVTMTNIDESAFTMYSTIVGVLL